MRPLSFYIPQGVLIFHPHIILTILAAWTLLFMMKFLSRSSSKAVNQEHEKAQAAPARNSSESEVKNAKEKTSLLELKLQQRNKISGKDLDNIVQLVQKLKQRDSDLSAQQNEFKNLEDKAHKVEDCSRCSDDEIQKLKASLQRRNDELTSAKNDFAEAKESLWKERKASLHTVSLLAQAEKDLMLTRAENDGKELEMLRLSNQTMRQQLEDANTRAELDHEALREERKCAEHILHTSQQEYERRKAEAKRDKTAVSVLEPLAESLGRELKISRAKEEAMTRRCADLDQTFQVEMQREKQKSEEAKNSSAGVLALVLKKLEQEQSRYEKMDADGKALVQELRKQLQAKNREKTRTELRLVQYGWDLQSRLNELKKEKEGEAHVPSPDSVESERQKFLEALFPAPVYHTQVSESSLEAITSIAELITTAFELRHKSDIPIPMGSKTPNPKVVETKNCDPNDEREFQETSNEEQMTRETLQPKDERYFEHLVLDYGYSSIAVVSKVPGLITVDEFKKYAAEELWIPPEEIAWLSYKGRILFTGKFLLQLR